MIPKSGDRIKLVAMPDDPAPIEEGALGTVTNVIKSSMGGRPSTQIWVDWDNGRNLMVVIPPDVVEVVGRADPVLPSPGFIQRAAEELDAVAPQTEEGASPAPEEEVPSGAEASGRDPLPPPAA